MMKRITNIIGFITAFAITVAAVFKINHFPGAGTALLLTGLLLGIYFPVFILARLPHGRLTLIAAVCSFFISSGVTFRVWHLPGSDILLVLGLGFFSLVFLPMKVSEISNGSSGKMVMSSAGALGLAFFATGILCKLMHWQGAAVLLSLSPVCLFAVYFPAYMMNRAIVAEQKHKYLLNSFFVIVIAALIILYFIKSIEIHDAI